MTIPALVGALLNVLSVAANTYAAVALAALARFVRQVRLAIAPEGPWPAVSVLKPLHGVEPHLWDNLLTFVNQDYPGPVEWVFGVATPADPAVAVVRALQRQFPALDIRLSTKAVALGANPKVNNLAGMLPLSRHPVLVLSDADIAVPAHYLKTVVAPLRTPDVGGVTCLYRGRAVLDNFWSRLLAAYINGWFLPSVLVALLGRPNAYGLGATIAVRRDALIRVGGLPAIANHLADDFRLAQLLQAHGFSVRLAPLVVNTGAAEPSWSALMRHLVRWARTTRAARPWGFAFSFLTYPIVLAVAALAVNGVNTVSGSLVVAAVALRWTLYRLGAAQHERPLAAIGIVLVTEWLAFAVYVAALARTRVEWRGRSYAVSRAGLLTPTEEKAAAYAEDDPEPWPK
jgi:ceramide glucosyltransferase